MRKAPFSICYFHIGDLLPESNGVMPRGEYEEYFKEKGTLINRYKRHIKSSLGKKGAWGKLEKLVAHTDFINLDMADKAIDWTACTQITL